MYKYFFNTQNLLSVFALGAAFLSSPSFAQKNSDKPGDCDKWYVVYDPSQTIDTSIVHDRESGKDYTAQSFVPNADTKPPGTIVVIPFGQMEYVSGDPIWPFHSQEGVELMEKLFAPNPRRCAALAIS